MLKSKQLAPARGLEALRLDDFILVFTLASCGIDSAGGEASIHSPERCLRNDDSFFLAIPHYRIFSTLLLHRRFSYPLQIYFFRVFLSSVSVRAGAANLPSSWADFA